MIGASYIFSLYHEPLFAGTWDYRIRIVIAKRKHMNFTSAFAPSTYLLNASSNGKMVSPFDLEDVTIVHD